MTGFRTLLAAGVATVLLLLATAAPVEAQVIVNRGFNRRPVVVNSWGGGGVRAMRRAYRRGWNNPWVAPAPVVNVMPVVNVAPNPWIQPVPVWAGPGPWVAAPGWRW
jgi:hypothetical protein